MLKVSKGGSDFEIVPEGQYTARCIKVIDLGTQRTEWAGQEKWQPKVMITWELLDDEVKMQDGKPFAITSQYTASLDERSRLFADLTAWRGKKFTELELAGFEIDKLLGAYCKLQVVHNQVGDKTYANFNAIMSTTDRPTGVNPLVKFDVNEPDMTVFETFSDWLKDKIRSSYEWTKEDKEADQTVVEPQDIEIEGEDVTDETPLSEIPF